MTELDDTAIEPNFCPALKVDAFGCAGAKSRKADTMIDLARSRVVVGDVERNLLFRCQEAVKNSSVSTQNFC